MEKIRGPIHLSIFIGFGKTELRQSTYSLHKHVLYNSARKVMHSRAAWAPAGASGGRRAYAVNMWTASKYIHRLWEDRTPAVHIFTA
jgi:hypothetical protein